MRSCGLVPFLTLFKICQPSTGRGRQHTILPKQLHGIERIWTGGGAPPNFHYVDPPLAIKITCAVVKEGKVNYVDLSDPGKCGEVLKGAKRPRIQKRHSKPELSWLDIFPGTYYHHLQDHHYDFTVRHVPYLADRCFDLKDLYKRREKKTRTTPQRLMSGAHPLEKTVLRHNPLLSHSRSPSGRVLTGYIKRLLSPPPSRDTYIVFPY